MVIINQPFGLGDVIFCQTLIHRLYLDKGEQVLWPVLPSFVDGLARAYPGIEFCNWKEAADIDFEDETQRVRNGNTVIPLRFKDVPLSTNMGRKYTSRGFDWAIWKENAVYQRDREREDNLYHSLIDADKPYNLISETFQADFRGGRKVIPPDNGLKNIYVKVIPGYSLFDWSKIFEMARTIHAVSSSNVYLFELLQLQAQQIKLYLRKPSEKTHANYDYLLRSHQYEFE